MSGPLKSCLASGDHHTSPCDGTCPLCPVTKEERGVCMNCGGDMDLSPMHPWCPDCDEAEEDEE